MGSLDSKVYDLEFVKKLTDDFWDLNAREYSANEQTVMQLYLKEHFPLELNYILNNAKGSEPHNGGTLVLMVGYSLEPLFLSICLQKPDRVIFIVNKEYRGRKFPQSGKDRFDMISELLEYMPEEYYDPATEIHMGQLEGDGPDEVFRLFQQELSDYDDLIIDVTGGKKSMISGAFLFAAYSNARISYVDFDDYDPDYSRPYGCTCKIANLSNPYQTFALQEWKQIESLYENYSFTAALNLLESIKPIMDFAYKEMGNEALSNLKMLLQMYEKWENYDYMGARKYRDQLIKNTSITREETPIIIDYFNWNWPNKLQNDDIMTWKITKIREANQEAVDILIRKPQAVYVYGRDEVNKARRLIDYYEDYRSALIRAAAISEFMIKPRIIILEPWVEINPQSSYQYNLAWFIHRGKMSQILDFLSGKMVTVDVGRGNSYTIMVKPGDEDQRLMERFKALLDDIQKLAEIRNAVIHGSLPVSKKLAESCVAIAEKNVNDFRGWLKTGKVDGQYGIIPWDRVKEVCNLSFIRG